MHRLNELADRLTPAQVKELEDFAEFLVSRNGSAGVPNFPARPDHKISFEGWAGCLSHVHPEMTDAEFSKLILDERSRQAVE